MSSNRQDLESIYSDLFKEVCGVRPRWIGNWSDEELQQEIEILYQMELDIDEPEDSFPTAGNGWAFTPAA